MVDETPTMGHEQNTASDSPTVLIAEDEEALRNILVQSFKSAGFQTIEAVDGQQALTLALQHKPMVIVLDIMMPVMDGMDALKKLRLDQWGKNAMVIMLTNLTADNKILQELSESAPSYYFVKSDMEPDQLIAKVKEILQ